MKIVFIIGVIAAIIAFWGLREGNNVSGKIWVVAVFVLFIVVNIFAFKSCSETKDYEPTIEYRHSD